ncbi:unnamed protein product, partial [Symbiodinium necroappetens]
VLDAGNLAKLSLPGVVPRGTSVSSGSSMIVTPKGEHYFVKCRTYGYRCLNCDSCSPDIRALKALKCDTSVADAALEAEAAGELQELQELEAEGRLLQDLLDQEQRELEALMLQSEIEELERQVALEEQQLMEAKILSLEEAARAARVEDSRQDVPVAKRARVEGPQQVQLMQEILPAASEANEANRALIQEVSPAAGKASEAKRALTQEVLPAAGPDCFDTIPYDWETVGLDDDVEPEPSEDLSAKVAGSGHPRLMRLCQVEDTQLEDDSDDNGNASPECKGSPSQGEGLSPTDAEAEADAVSLVIAPSEAEICPPCPTDSKVKSLSPAEQSRMSGAKAKGKAKGKAKAKAKCPREAEDEDKEGSDVSDDEEDSKPALKRPSGRGLCRGGGRGGRGGRTGACSQATRGRGRGRGRGKNAKDDENDDDEASGTEDEEDAEEPKPSPKKGTEPKGRTNASKDNGAADASKAKPRGKAKAKAVAKSKEQLAKEAKSRKSVAYHRAYKSAKDKGKSDADCKLAAKKGKVLAPWGFKFRCLHDELLVSSNGKFVLALQVLLLRWMKTLSYGGSYEFFELFAGEGKVTGVWHEKGYTTASFDKLYGDPMDFLKNSGFTIACWVVMNEVPDGFNLIGPDCSSWGMPARASSMRSTINPYGRMGNSWVSSNYCLVSRLVLLLLLMLSRHCTWVVEQPIHSLLPSHRRWEWMCNQVVKVYKQSFWMMLHGAGCPKRTLVLSPMATIAELDLGRLTKAEKEKRCTFKTVRRHRGKDGKMKFSGQKGELKKSGHLAGH